MADMMTFPNTVEEFMEQYKITDTEQIYTNGAELVPIFRMKQWFDYEPERKTGKWEIYVISMLDGEGCKCSECGFEGVPYWDFCPNCGAEMRGEENETD